MVGFIAGESFFLFNKATLAPYFCSLQSKYSTRNSKHAKESQRGKII